MTWNDVWNGISHLTQPQATVLGAMLAALLGFGTLAAGHILNAYLGRKRDRYLYNLEQLNLLRALVAEVRQIENLVTHQISLISDPKAGSTNVSVVSPASFSVVFAANLARLHLLPSEALSVLILFNTGLAEYEYNLQVAGGSLSSLSTDKLRSFNFGPGNTEEIQSLKRGILSNCRITLGQCEPIISHLQTEIGEE